MTETAAGGLTGVRRGSCGFVVTGIDLDPSEWNQIPRFFSDLESAGCDSIWLTDHLFSGHPSAEPLVLAGVAAAATTHARIGTGVLQLALRRGAAVAKAASTLQLLSGGRFVLGIGVGLHAREFERAGVDFSRRGTAVDQLLVELQESWKVTDDWFTMRPSAPPPIWVGGTSAAAFRRVVDFGSGWLSIFQSPQRFAESNHRLSEALQEAGRRPDSVERRIVLFVCPTDAAWSRSDALKWIGRQFPGGSEGVDRHVITGSVSECVGALRAFESSDVDGIDLQITHPEPFPYFEILRRELAAPGNQSANLVR